MDFDSPALQAASENHVAHVYRQPLDGEHDDFDFQTVFADLDNEHPDVRNEALAMAACGLSRILCYVFDSPNLRAATVKLAVIGRGIRPSLVGDANQPELAQQCGVTKQAVSKATKHVEAFFGVRLWGVRSPAACARMKAAAFRAHQRRRNGSATPTRRRKLSRQNGS